MSRPRKAVVDYFPHYVAHRKSMFIIEQKYGNNGYAFWFKLLECLGDTENHYLDINETDTFEFLLAKTRVNETEAREILNLLVRVHSIDSELYAHGIIFSQNFIDNLDAVYARRGVKLYTKAYLLELMSTKTPLSGVNVDINPQSRVEYSKVEYSKVKDVKKTKKNDVENDGTVIDLIDQINIDFEFAWKLYQKKRGDFLKLKKKWEALTDAEREKAIEHIPRYVESTPEKMYRKDFETYLNNKSFNDEIIKRTEKNENRNTSTTKSGADLITELFK